MTFNQVPVNLSMSAGAGFSQSFVIRNDDYSPRNIERCILKGYMSKHPGALNAHESTSTDPVYVRYPFDVQVPNGTDGRYVINMSSTDSMAISEGKYVYNVVMTNTVTGTVESLLSGLIFVDVAFASFP
jgi:hypothetical protein